MTIEQSASQGAQVFESLAVYSNAIYDREGGGRLGIDQNDEWSLTTLWAGKRGAARPPAVGRQLMEDWCQWLWFSSVRWLTLPGFLLGEGKEYNEQMGRSGSVVGENG